MQIIERLLYNDLGGDRRSRDQIDGALLPFGLTRPVLPCSCATAPGEAHPSKQDFGRKLPRYMGGRVVIAAAMDT